MVVKVAKLFPNLENIARLKVQPTEGESFLINYLNEYLDDDVEIYFQPFLNGDRPDIVLIKKDVGVCIIEVKDWNLNSYKVDENNRWQLKYNNQLIKSPFQQVFAYKDNMFNLHINGLLEEKIKNKMFYGRIQPYVYFHKASKKDIEMFYTDSYSNLKCLEETIQANFKSSNITHQNYTKQLDHLKQMKSKIQRDQNYCAISNDNLAKIKLPQVDSQKVFKETIYQEFQRYLQPPYHTLNEGKELTYSKKQEILVVSSPTLQKIKGVAGSGKTVVLAKRAVNSYKRHDGRVLILTFNITLKSYVHDKISDVRENFDWNCFYITNYHQFITIFLNNAGIEIELPEGLDQHEISDYLDQHYYSNMSLFEILTESIHQYKAIFIDEIQDYKPVWINIIKRFFLQENGEMVLFGDEKQNIYQRDLDKEKKIKIPQGFGRWEYLNKSIRHQGDGGRILDLSKKFQKTFFEKKYEIDEYDEAYSTPSLNLGIYKMQYYTNNKINLIVESIYQEIKDHNIQPNDICILSSNIEILKEVDYIIRHQFNEKSQTTFETKEMSQQKPLEVKSVRKNKKIAFNLNSGVIKLSTIHSFKGYEVPTLFLIIDEKDNEEMIYAGITRSMFDIMVFTHVNGKYNDFFEKELELI